MGTMAGEATPVVRPGGIDVRLKGALSAENAPMVEEDGSNRFLAENAGLRPMIDARERDYISSAVLHGLVDEVTETTTSIPASATQGSSAGTSRDSASATSSPVCRIWARAARPWLAT